MPYTIFKIEMRRGSRDPLVGAFTVGGDPMTEGFAKNAAYQAGKKIEAMVRVASGNPKPGDIDDGR